MEERKSSLSLEDRKKLTLSGVLEVINFDDEKISLNTILGNLAIKGEGLKMNKLDVQNGDVIIIGYISSMIYSGKDGKKSKESIIKKIFK
ncbi:sporulation protein YabP [Clostridium paraputrificum]|uniref:Spore protein YabP n=1 Tax=Clostridium paraputrificum TaxID=29363 RepID=A0A6N2Y5S5_9CLOT